ncbi:unnamed protein product, partial [Urochloa humidicola]
SSSSSYCRMKRTRTLASYFPRVPAIPLNELEVDESPPISTVEQGTNGSAPPPSQGVSADEEMEDANVNAPNDD